MSVAIILLDGLISGVEMGSEIPVQRSELIGLKSILESELSQLRADNEALKKQVSSYKLLTNSMEKSKTYLLKKADQNKEAVDTLASEREANAVLTEENATLKAELAEANRAYECQDEKMNRMYDELAEAKNDAELLKHCEGACRHLPEGWEIKICLEKWAGWVDLYDPEGNEVSFDCDHERLETMVKNAIDAAMKEK